MNIAFFGSPNCASGFLEKLLTDTAVPVSVRLVVTQPDKPVGRKKVLTPSPVKEIAQKYQIKIFDAEPTSPALIELIRTQGIELALLFAYGEIIKKDLLIAPKYGFWNIHPSLLPRYRGASPIAYPLMLGEGTTGVTLMQMDSDLDHGPIIAQKRVEVSPIDFREPMEERLSHISYKLFLDKIAELVQNNGRIEGIHNQNHDDASYTRQLTKLDGYLPWGFIKLACSDAPTITAEFPPELSVLHEHVVKYKAPLPRQKTPAGEMLWNFFRGISPWPGIWTTVEIKGQPKRLKLTSLFYNFETTRLSIEKVQLEGKNEVDFKTFQKAYGIF